MKNIYLTYMGLLMSFMFLSFSVQAQGPFDPTLIYKIANQNGGGVIEIGGGGTVPNDIGSKANMWPYAGGANQEWTLEAVGGASNGPYKIRSRNSNQVLEIGGSTATTTSWGAQANQWPDYGNTNQLWNINVISNNGTSVYIVEIANVRSGMLLSTNEIPATSGGEIIYQATGRANRASQQWAITQAGTLTPHLGVYKIINNRSGQALEVGGSNVASGGAINQWPYYGNANQQWVIADAGNGFYSILNRNSNQALEIGGSSYVTYSAGTTANQYSYYGGENQQWAIDFTNGIITNRRSGLVLEIGGGYSTTVANGSAANQWYDYGNNNQRWTLTKVSQNRVATATAQQKADDQALVLYPNPASTILTFTLANDAKAKTLVINDIRGSVVKSVLCQGNNQLDVSDLSPGIYVVVISDGTRTYRKKLIKQ